MFVSSTFRDMQAEREELVKRVFPQLRELCESRGVTWGEVDLRWGITEEQQARGEVLSICLAEIEECRPYFIGLLGERYGSVPGQIDPALVAQEPWLGQAPELSVTELEIVHGVLRDPEMAQQAFFYFRDPAYAQREPGLLEAPTEEEIRELGADRARARAEWRRAKLAELKDRIRASGLPLHDNYRDPAQLGQLVLADLTAVVDRLFPADSEPTPAERERALHEEFARARAEVYVARDRDLERLDRHAAGTAAPLVVVGESGVGKSALLANWGLRWREAGGRLVMHFVAASPGSRDWMGMLRRIIADLNAGFDLGIAVPDDAQELRTAFAAALQAAAERDSFVLLIDALDQLEDRDGAPDLAWLPSSLPPNLRLVLSTLPGRALSEVRRRGWKTFKVRPLRRREREQLIVGYLAQYAKALPAGAVRQIATARPAANPLFLRSLLEELRLHGDHLTVERRASELLAAAGRRSPASVAIPKLFELILERWETDFDRDRPELVWDAMTLIASARRGLAESELLELLGDGSGPLPHAFWSPLRLAAKQVLAESGGLLTFSHDYIRRTVTGRYLFGPDEVRAAHARLAEYFAGRPPTATRTLEELPWQLREAGAWDRLYDVLADAEFRDALGEHRDYELTGYWLSLERETRARGIVDAYEPVLRAPGAQEASVVVRVAKLLADTGHDEQALTLYEHLVRHYTGSGDGVGLQAALGRSAEIMRARGDLDAAYGLYSQQEQISLEIGSAQGLQAALGGRARVLIARGDLDGAQSLVVERENLCRDTRDHAGLAAAVGDDALIQRLRGHLDTAVARHAEQERLAREAGDPRLVANALNGQAAILVARGKLRRADRLLAEWHRTWWDFSNDADRQRWQLAANLTTANRNVVFYLKMAIVLLAGFVPIVIASIQIGTQVETVSNQVLSKFLVGAVLAAVAVIGLCVWQAAAWRWRLVRARTHYRSSEIRSEVGAQPAFAGQPALAVAPSLLRDPNARITPFKAAELKLRAATSEQTVRALALSALVVGSVLTGTGVHHLLGTTLPCFHVASNVAPCSGGFGWYFAMVVGGLLLVIASGVVVEGSVVFPVFLGTMGVESLVAGLGSPAVGITKTFPIAFGIVSLVAGVTLGSVFWVTVRR